MYHDEANRNKIEKHAHYVITAQLTYKSCLFCLGYRGVKTDFTYSWKPVNNTNFAVCIVVASDELDTKVKFLTVCIFTCLPVYPAMWSNPPPLPSPPPLREIGTFKSNENVDTLGFTIGHRRSCSHNSFNHAPHSRLAWARTLLTLIGLITVFDAILIRRQTGLE